MCVSTLELLLSSIALWHLNLNNVGWKDNIQLNNKNLWLYSNIEFTC